MDAWKTALYGSPLWLLEAFFGTLAVGLMIVGLCARSGFAKQFFRVVRPCIGKKNIISLLAVMSLMLLLLLTEVRLNVLNTYFYNGLYASLQKGMAEAFWFFALVNAGIVGLRTLNDVVNEFFDRGFAIKWSEKLNTVLVGQWLADKNYYKLQFVKDKPDNIDQRIQQDAQDFVSTTVEFVRGMINAVVSGLEFTLVLWALSGVLAIFGIEIPRGMVFLFLFLFYCLLQRRCG